MSSDFKEYDKRLQLLEKCKIKADKRTLLLIAGLFWSLAGWRVLSFGYGDLFANTASPWGFLLISLLVFMVFFSLIFSKMVKKHADRIKASNQSKHCVFAFLDIKGYGVMALMMGGGIVLRNSHIVYPVYLGSVYLGIGSALLSAGLKALNAFMYY
jgi:hypothetical protein